MTGMFSDDMRRNPYPIYERMRAASPLLHIEPPGLWMIFDYDGVKRALNDPDSFSSQAQPPGSTGKPLEWLIFFDPPHHTKLRAIINRVFTPRSVAALEPRMRQMVDELLSDKVEHGEMDLAEDLAIPLPLMVIAEIIGIPLADRLRFKRWSAVILGLSDTIASPGDAAQRAAGDFRAATVEMKDYLAQLLDQRRAQPQDDILTRLIAAEVDGEGLTEEEIIGFFQLLLLAGTETTTNLINNAILCLIENPEQNERLNAHPELLPNAIEEVLRYRSPVQAVFRATKKDVEVHGQTIPAGQLVLAAIGSANRDPKQFPDADRFDIMRDPNPHIAFGHGAHFCLGAALSRLEARVVLSDLLARLRDIGLASSEPWEPRKAFHVHGPTKLPIRFTPTTMLGR